MTDENDAKLNEIMNNTNMNDEKYFCKQKAKLSSQAEKVKQYLNRIKQIKSNANLWHKTEKEV